MNILSIETSCDETAISILRAKGTLSSTDTDSTSATFEVLGDTLLSQAGLHKEYGGVYPSLAKREHAKNLVPILHRSLEEAKMLHNGTFEANTEQIARLKEILEREPKLFEQLSIFLKNTGKPEIDAIAVTSGPGLEPALWVGINFAKALSYVWNIPMISTNHMEGHIFSGLMTQSEDIFTVLSPQFPILALLISGGHTEMVLMKNWNIYQVIGTTRDDAVGEAFDKVARMLSLPYPGGPEISRLAEMAREKNLILEDKLPRPMLNSDNFDFSFSGLKTAVLYLIKNMEKNGEKLTEETKQKIAREFEDSATEVLVHKVEKALEEHGALTLVIGGGVSANTHIKKEFEEKLGKLGIPVLLPQKNLTTDNAVMIGVAGYFNYLNKKVETEQGEIVANGNMSF